MAVLTSSELVELRQAIARDTATQDWTKADINAALQAVEDWFEGERTVVSGLIDTATAPHVFTNGQKKKLVRQFLAQKFRREAS